MLKGRTSMNQRARSQRRIAFLELDGKVQISHNEPNKFFASQRKTIKSLLTHSEK